MTDERMPQTGLVYNGTEIQAKGERLNLTDMWRASGADPSKRPYEWSRKEGAPFVEAVALSLNAPVERIYKAGRGKNGSTAAHWQIGLAYAKYLSPEFHMWCNTVVRERMEGKPVPALLTEEVRRTDGISRMLAHKVTGIERDVGDIGRAVIELAQEVKALVIASDPRMGAVTSVPALQIAIEQGVKKRPRGLSLLIGNALARYCEGKKEFVVHRDIYDRRLFPRAAVNEWIAQGGWGPIKDTIDRKGGQGVFRLIPIKQAKPATPEARP